MCDTPGGYGVPSALRVSVINRASHWPSTRVLSNWPFLMLGLASCCFVLFHSENSRHVMNSDSLATVIDRFNGGYI